MAERIVMQCLDCNRALYLGTHTECKPKKKGGEYKIINPKSRACGEFCNRLENPRKLLNQVLEDFGNIVTDDVVWAGLLRRKKTKEAK